MKRLLIFLFLIPLVAFTQSKTNSDSESKKMAVNQKKINHLVKKYKKILKSTGGAEGWKLQIKFTSKREDILPYQVKFTNLYTEIPAQITFDSPYYKLTVGNFKTKNEALKVKHKISKNFPGAHPISIIIDQGLLER